MRANAPIYCVSVILLVFPGNQQTWAISVGSPLSHSSSNYSNTSSTRGVRGARLRSSMFLQGVAVFRKGSKSSIARGGGYFMSATKPAFDLTRSFNSIEERWHFEFSRIQRSIFDGQTPSSFRPHHPLPIGPRNRAQARGLCCYVSGYLIATQVFCALAKVTLAHTCAHDH